MQALQLRMSGATLAQVAERVGYNSEQAVWAAVTSLLEHQTVEATTEWRQFQLTRLERLLLGVWNNALAGDDKASQQALRILQEIGKVTGVYAPIKAEITGAGGGPIEAHQVLTWVPDDEWRDKFVAAWEDVRVAHATPVEELNGA